MFVKLQLTNGRLVDSVEPLVDHRNPRSAEKILRMSSQCHLTRKRKTKDLRSTRYSEYYRSTLFNVMFHVVTSCGCATAGRSVKISSTWSDTSSKIFMSRDVKSL